MSLWEIRTMRASVRDIHASELGDFARSVRICMPTDRALVLGSAQPESDVDRAVAQANDIDIVRRRSGGGAVLVEPADMLWIDVTIPTSDPLWVSDVGHAFHWLGHAIADSLVALGYERTNVHHGALVTTDWSRKVCFAGLGPGEAVINGRKIVGISQRRKKEGALFQCALVKHFKADLLGRLLRVPSANMQQEVETLVGSLDDLDDNAFVGALTSRISSL